MSLDQGLRQPNTTQKYYNQTPEWKLGYHLQPVAPGAYVDDVKIGCQTNASIEGSDFASAMAWANFRGPDVQRSYLSNRRAIATVGPFPGCRPGALHKIRLIST